jgi:hypothetical protein
MNRLAGGLRDLPRNAAWVAARGLGRLDGAGEATAEAATSLGHEAADTARRAGAAIKDATPGTRDSVELRLARARAAAERAREAEDRAVAAADRAREQARNAQQVAEDEDARLDEVRHDQDDWVDQRTEEARRLAEPNRSYELMLRQVTAEIT